jgi:hypothetical protein
MIDLILLIPVAILGALLWRADRRYDRALEAFEAERKELLTRIQAPELAPTLSAPEPTGEQLYVSPELDEEWTDYVEARKAGEVS